MGLSVKNSDKMPLEWASLDEKTKEISSKIFDLANGLTPSQFCEAIEFALWDLNRQSILTFPTAVQKA